MPVYTRRDIFWRSSARAHPRECRTDSPVDEGRWSHDCGSGCALQLAPRPARLVPVSSWPRDSPVCAQVRTDASGARVLPWKCSYFEAGENSRSCPRFPALLREEKAPSSPLFWSQARLRCGAACISRVRGALWGCFKVRQQETGANRMGQEQDLL